MTRQIGSLPEVMAELGISRSALRKWRQHPAFPKPLDLPGHPKFDLAEIRAFGSHRRNRICERCAQLTVQAWLNAQREAGNAEYESWGA